ncbi:molybdopterin-guanine dinucleotide biosynthesis protein MobB [Candidatus Magnetominusculus dajiuhuensis]|uniref:molybdopterin-guanine dinucleotide biosynthesis protein MobB n=1 Tax=Candidatus Magnetominusculus dajiuhuensis TaxID=3137712 RepID=UPI003B42D901
MCIGGAHSSCGKTTLAERLLTRLKARKNGAWGAVKYTQTAFYTSVSDAVDTGDKDTARLLNAGAQRVQWIQSPRHELEEVIRIALDKFWDMDGILVEGNSPTGHIEFDVVAFVFGDDPLKIKDSAKTALKKASVLVLRDFQLDTLPYVPLSGGVKTCNVRAYDEKWDEQTMESAGENRDNWDNCAEVILDEIVRKEIEITLTGLSQDGKIPCALARKAAEGLGVSYGTLGDAANLLNIRITSCELGCF